MKDSSIVKIAMRATKKTAHKKSVTISDSDVFGVCRYVSTSRGIFRVMNCDFGYMVEGVGCVGL